MVLEDSHFSHFGLEEVRAYGLKEKERREAEKKKKEEGRGEVQEI